MAGILGGLALAAGSLAMGLNGWAMDRLWLYLLGSAMAILVGVQLVLNWVLVRVLAELSRRERPPAPDAEQTA